MWSRENEFDHLIRPAAVKFALPVWAIKATIAKESSFNPRSFQDKPSPISSDDSRGLMQLLDGTARWLGYTGPVGNDISRTGGLYDPATSIHYGSKYLAYQRKRYPSAPWDHIYAAFNAGSVRFTKTAPRKLVNESNVDGWREAADHFNPGWRALVPFVCSRPDCPRVLASL